MKVFYIAIISTYITALIGRLTSDKNKKAGILFSLATISILTWIAAVRNGIGDTGDYKHLYEIINAEYNILESGYEPGFIIFLMFLKLISTNPQFMVIVTALITTGINIAIIRKYCDEGFFEIGVYVYIASGYFLVTMNGIRQSLVASILLLGTDFIIKGNFKKYLILVLFATTMHSSALVMIPLYFVARTEVWSKNIFKILICFILGMMLYQPIMDIIFELLKGTKYGEYNSFQEGGANVLRIIVSGVPVLLAYLYREKLKLNWNVSDVFVNISLLNFLIMCFSGYNWIFARFAIYTQVYTFILLACIMKICFKGSERRLIYYCLIVCYFVFFYYEYTMSLTAPYIPVIRIKDMFYN